MSDPRPMEGLPPDALRLMMRDAASGVVALVAAASCFDPNFGLRAGALLCALAIGLVISDVRLRATDVAAVAFAALCWTSLAWSINADATELTATNATAGAAIFIAVRSVSRTRRGWMAVSAGLATGTVYTVYRLFTDNSLQVGLTLNEQGDRHGLEGVNQNYLAYAIVTGLLIVLLLWISAQRIVRWTVPVVAIMGLGYVGVLVAGTRGALLGGALSLVWVAWFLVVRPPSSSRRLIALLWFVIVLEVTIVAGWFETAVRSQIVQSAREQGDLNGRFVLWPAASDWWAHHLLVGTGAGTFEVVSPLPDAPAHNVALDIGSGLGIGGVALFTWLLYHALVTESRGASRRVVVVGAYVTATAPMLLSGFWYLSPVFWVGLALQTTIHRALHDADAVVDPESAAQASGVAARMPTTVRASRQRAVSRSSA